ELARAGGINKEIAESIYHWEKNWSLAEEWEKIRALGLNVIDCKDPLYPPRLAEIYDPPLVLYYKGDLDAARRRAIAVVGSRHATSYGFETARKLSYQCAYAGLTVVSGLAQGIDTAGHQGALAAKGKTVAVFGSSLDKVYPAENQTLAEKIVENGGAILSEFRLGTPPDRYTFPMRNRIVSGLSEGVLVIEAGKTSGAMITAHMAGEQGRQVFAVPGRIDNPRVSGCHALIKDGAKLVENVDDIFAEFSLLFPKTEMQPSLSLPNNLSAEEKKVVEAIDNDEIGLDEIIRKCGLPSAVVSSSLLRLELKRLVRRLPGKCFIRIN
ncbi:MAG: DNA-processing protein DprA, partial [bacterium]